MRLPFSIRAAAESLVYPGDRGRPRNRMHRMIRIAIDLTALRPVVTGVDVTLLELVRYLAKVDTRNRYTLFVNVEDRERLRRIVGTNMRLWPCCSRLRIARLVFLTCIAPILTWLGGFDLLHWPSFLMPLWRGRRRHLLTVHDLTFFTHPEHHNRLHSSRIFRECLAASIRKADAINVPSEAVRSDLRKIFPEIDSGRVFVTPWGIDPAFCPAPAADIQRHVKRLNLPARYVLSVSTVEPRKNRGTLLEAFRRLIASSESSLDLVIAGAKGWNHSSLYIQASAPDLRGRVHFLGYVPSEDLPWVYRGRRIRLRVCERGLRIPAFGSDGVWSDGSGCGQFLPLREFMRRGQPSGGDRRGEDRGRDETLARGIA
jgi:glycosyltransferase involved in cell wall biosynthesis